MNVRNPIAITHNPSTPWKNKTSQAINSLNLIAGDGINLDYSHNGITIRTEQDSNLIRMNFMGDYDFDMSYHVGDVVTVPYTANFKNENGDVVPIGSTTVVGYDPIPTAIAAFVCTTYVPPSLYTSDYVTTNVLPQFSGQAIPDEWINGTRFYDLNVYYPIYPEIPSVYTSSVAVFNSTAKVTANNTFWKCLGIAAVPGFGCIGSNGAQEINYSPTIASGSIFQTVYLPYQ